MERFKSVFSYRILFWGNMAHISKIGYIYSPKVIETCLLPDEAGNFTLGNIYTSRKMLSKRFGNEWGKLAVKVRITIEELTPSQK